MIQLFKQAILLILYIVAIIIHQDYQYSFQIHIV